MDRELAGEAFAARCFGFGAQALFVPEVGEHPIDRLHARSDCASKAQVTVRACT